MNALVIILIIFIFLFILTGIGLILYFLTLDVTGKISGEFSLKWTGRSGEVYYLGQRGGVTPTVVRFYQPLISDNCDAFTWTLGSGNLLKNKALGDSLVATVFDGTTVATANNPDNSTCSSDGPALNHIIRMYQQEANLYPVQTWYWDRLRSEMKLKCQQSIIDSVTGIGSFMGVNGLDSGGNLAVINDSLGSIKFEVVKPIKSPICSSPGTAIGPFQIKQRTFPAGQPTLSLGVITPSSNTASPEVGFYTRQASDPASWYDWYIKDGKIWNGNRGSLFLLTTFTGLNCDTSGSPLSSVGLDGPGDGSPLHVTSEQAIPEVQTWSIFLDPSDTSPNKNAWICLSAYQDSCLIDSQVTCTTSRTYIPAVIAGVFGSRCCGGFNDTHNLVLEGFP